MISECYDPGMTKVFKKDPKILDFQSCGSVNNLGNEKIHKSLILPIVMIWLRQKKFFKNPKILEFQWCESVYIVRNEKIQKSFNSNGVEV